MSDFFVNLKRLSVLLLPTGYRKPLIVSILFAGISPLNELYVKFMGFRDDAEYRLTHNGQVCYLRALLNDMFDQDGRRITVGSYTTEEPDNILYMREEDRPRIIPMRASGEVFIFNRRGYGGADGFDFWVSIPNEIAAEIDIERLKTVINTYKLASKRFAITYH